MFRPLAALATAALFFAALFSAALVPVSAHAACSGPDYLDGLSRSNPDLADRLDAEVARAPFAKGRFWRIEKDGRVSHAFGTFHSPDADIARVPPGVRDVVGRARVLLVEILPEEEERMQGMIARDPSMIMDLSGAPLSSWLDRREIDALDGLLRGYGLTASAADRMQPWFVNLLLSIPPCMVNEMAAGAEVLDDLVINAGRDAGVDVRGLERVEDALEVFQAFSQADQRLLLQLNLSMANFSEAIMVSSERLYLSDDIWRVWAMNGLMAKALGLSDELQPILDVFYQRALVDRNQNWMPQILRELARGDAVIAVGALHLAGPDSLQVMLEAEGYTITRLDMAGTPYDAPADSAKPRQSKPDLPEDEAAPGNDATAPEKKTK